MITTNDFEELGFTPVVPGTILESWTLVLIDETLGGDLIDTKQLVHYKSLSCTLCNDKGQGEYYLFVREGYSNDRVKDDIVTLTNNLQERGDLEEFIRLLKL